MRNSNIFHFKNWHIRIRNVLNRFGVFLFWIVQIFLSKLTLPIQCIIYQKYYDYAAFFSFLLSHFDQLNKHREHVIFLFIKNSLYSFRKISTREKSHAHRVRMKSTAAAAAAKQQQSTKEKVEDVCLNAVHTMRIYFVYVSHMFRRTFHSPIALSLPFCLLHILFYLIFNLSCSHSHTLLFEYILHTWKKKHAHKHVQMNRKVKSWIEWDRWREREREIEECLCRVHEYSSYCTKMLLLKLMDMNEYQMAYVCKRKAEIATIIIIIMDKRAQT